MQLLLQAEFAELERLTNWIAALRGELRLSEQTAHHIDLCLTELVTNIMNYAYPGGEKREPIEIRASRDNGQIAFQISDEGIQFDPSAYVPSEPAKSLADAPVGGQGLRLVQRLSDGITYRRNNGVNQVTVIFRMTHT